MGVLFAIFGLVFLVFAAVALVAGTSMTLLVAHLALGAGFLFYALLTSFAELRALAGQGVSSRGARYGGNTMLQTLVFTAILAMGAFVTVRNPVNWDWTEAQVHSLAPATLDLLAEIPADPGIEILAFFIAGSEEPAKSLLDRYAYESEGAKARFIDPRARPEVAQRHEINTNGIVLVCAGPCADAKAINRVSEVSEEKLSSAIRSVISEKRKTYFLIGHGEAALDDTETTGVSRLKLALEDENMQVEPLLLANQENVPDDADAVLVVGPDRNFLERELQALDRYLRGGGSLLVLYDAFHELNLADQLRDWGIETRNDVIIDQQIQLFAGPKLGVQPVVNDYGAHAITEDMGGRPTLFNVARSLKAVDGAGPGGEDGTSVELAFTSQASWGESDVKRFLEESRVDLGDGDNQGPVAVAVARSFPVQAEGEEAGEAEGRLVVAGDADFARNRYISEFFNADLLLNAANWLVGEEEFISIERKLPRASRAVMTTEQFQNFRYLSLFGLPELILLGGIVVWWRRRT